MPTEVVINDLKPPENTWAASMNATLQKVGLSPLKPLGIPIKGGGPN
jgi:hypothetical protein